MNASNPASFHFIEDIAKRRQTSASAHAIACSASCFSLGRDRASSRSPQRPGVAAHAAQRIRCQYLSNGKRVVSYVDPDGARDDCGWDIFWPGEILEPDRVPAMEFSALC